MAEAQAEHDGQLGASQNPRQELDRARRVALCFVSDPESLPKLKIFAMVLDAQQELMRFALEVSGDEWHAKEDSMVVFVDAHGKEYRRNSRVMLAAQNVAEVAFTKRMSDLLLGGRISQALCVSEQTVHLRTFAFKLIGIAGAMCEQLLAAPHRRYPFKVFGLGCVEGADLETALVNERPCVLDSWSLSFRTHFAGRLNGADAAAELDAVARLVHTDTAQIEARHSGIRRRVLKSSLQTHLQRVQHASSDFVCARLASQGDAPKAQDEQAEEADQERLQLQGHRGQKRKRGGGGPWRAWCHLAASGQRRRPDWSELSLQYHALSAETRAELEEVGALATVAHRHGHAGFGPTTRQAQRSRVKRLRAEQKDRAMAEARSELEQLCNDGQDVGQALAPHMPDNNMDMVVAYMPSWDEFVSSTRAEAARMDLRRRCMDAVLSEALSSWRAAIPDDCGRHLCTALPAGPMSLEPAPQSGSFDRCWTWRFPGCLQIVSNALAVRGETRAGKALSNALAEDSNNHQHLICAKDVAPIVEKRRPSSICVDAGFCLCDASGRVVHFFGSRLLGTLKAACPPDSGNRALLVGCCIGLMLIGVPVPEAGSASSEVGVHTTSEAIAFVHVSLQYLSPFRPTFQRMSVERISEQSVQCRARPEWVTFWDFMREFDTQRQWTMRILSLSDTFEPVADTSAEIQEYSELASTVPGLFWRGAADCERGRQRSVGPSGADEGAEVAEDGAESPGNEVAESEADSVSSGSTDESVDPWEAEHEGNNEHVAGEPSDADLVNHPPVEAPPVDAALAEARPVAGGGGAEGEGPSRRPADEYFSVPGGEIRFYSRTGRFVGHCENVAHGRQCRREKLSSSGRNRPQGRPLGYLMAWLAQGDAHASQRDHMQGGAKISLAERQAGREALRGINGSQFLFDAERPRRQGEGEEPDECP